MINPIVFMREAPHTKRRQYKKIAIIGLVVCSLAWTAYDWSGLQRVKVQASQIALVGSGLILTEAAFIIGGLLMLASLGVEIAGTNHLHRWYKSLRYIRREIKTITSELVISPIFSLGFWLNFTGAVGTSLLLAYTIIQYLPVAGWGFLILITLDLIATFGWRVPLQIKRKDYMKKRNTIIRQATAADIDSYLRLQSERWAEDNMARRDQLESRLRAYPQGMLVAEQDGEVVGMVSAMRITDYDYTNPPSWSQITHDGYCDNADPAGAVIFGVDLSTRRGSRCGDKLLLGIGRLVIAEGVETALLGGRLPGYHAYADQMTAAQYLRAKDDQGRPLDPQVRFYTSVPGLKAVKVIPDYFNDPDSLNYGVLLQWRNPFYRLPGRRLWSALFPIVFKLEELYSSLSRPKNNH